MRNKGLLPPLSAEDMALLEALNKLDYLKSSEHYTPQQVCEVVKLIFPTKVKNPNQYASSYGLKHVLERVTRHRWHDMASKYCHEHTLVEGMELAGFTKTLIGHSLYNSYFNFSTKDHKRIERLTERVMMEARRKREWGDHPVPTDDDE